MKHEQIIGKDETQMEMWHILVYHLILATI